MITVIYKILIAKYISIKYYTIQATAHFPDQTLSTLQIGELLILILQ